MATFWPQPEINQSATLQKQSLLDGAIAEETLDAKMLKTSMRVVGLDDFVNTTQKLTAKQTILWVLEKCEAVPAIGATLSEWYNSSNSVTPVEYAEWFVTNRVVVSDGYRACRIEITWTYLTNKTDRAGVVHQENSGIHFVNNTPTMVEVEFDGEKTAGEIVVLVPRVTLRITRNYRTLLTLRTAISQFLGKVNDAVYDSYDKRQLLVTSVSVQMIGDTERSRVTWVVESCSPHGTHDPILVYRKRGIIPTGVTPLDNWDGTANLNYNAAQGQWNKNGVRRIQYYSAADFSAL
jgi:hypothetical protein